MAVSLSCIQLSLVVSLFLLGLHIIERIEYYVPEKMDSEIAVEVAQLFDLSFSKPVHKIKLKKLL